MPVIAKQRNQLAAAEFIVGRELYSWQRRLLLNHLLTGDCPASLDIPTGLGKTAVMALWLAALAQGAPLPRRLVYVVDRRAVVDQASSEADRLARLLGSGDDPAELVIALRQGLGLRDGQLLPVSTLRGQHADNRRWLKDPSRPAIIVGTVDMIGSRLLFSGYGVARKLRPVHAGLLAVDALVVLDEAHLVPAFESLVRQIQGLRHVDMDGINIPPFKVMALSATGRTEVPNTFSLRDDDMQDPRIRARLDAVKRLRVLSEVPPKELSPQLASRAWDLAQPAAAVLVFCNSRKTAVDVAERLRRRLREVHGRGTHGVELLVGERRVHERQRLTESEVFRRFLPRDGHTGQAVDLPAFLVATSAGEVGIDLDADHMVCDLVPWERMVQRAGRVNRRQLSAHQAVIEVVPVRLTAGKDEAETEINDERLSRLLAPFAHSEWQTAPDGTLDASVGTLHLIKQSASMSEAIAEASTEPPLWPELTMPLVHAWSMTSVKDHTGRPEVQPWLRGWIDQEQQTRVIWRRWFPLRAQDVTASSDQDAVKRELETFFEEAAPHLVESLEAPPHRVARMVRKRAGDWLAAERSRPAEQPNPAGFEPAHAPVVVVLSNAGDVEEILACEALSQERLDRLQRLFAGSTVIVDARLGGLDENGLLDESAKNKPITIDQTDVLWPGLADVGFRVQVGPPKPSEVDWRVDYRWAFEPDDESSERIELRVEVWRGGESLQGDPALARTPQELQEHMAAVLSAVNDTATELGLPPSLTSSLARVAEFHDSGKARPLWQRAMGAPRDGRLYAKTDGRNSNPRLLRIGDFTYRHEFGSLQDAIASNELQAVPSELDDLWLHLIASHHGKARPEIPPIDPAVPPSKCPPVAQAAARRFERLNRRWGPWELAWLEAIFRAADWKASSGQQEGDGA